MTTEEAKALKVGDRVIVRRESMPREENATVIARPSPHHAPEYEGYRWLEFDGTGNPEIRRITIHAREIKRKQNETH